MALADTVTGPGRVISGNTEIGQIETPFERDGQQKIRITNYTDTRIQTKWYALTLDAIDNYKLAHPTANVSFRCVSEINEAYEMTLHTVSRQITGMRVINAPQED